MWLGRKPRTFSDAVAQQYDVIRNNRESSRARCRTPRIRSGQSVAPIALSSYSHVGATANNSTPPQPCLETVSEIWRFLVFDDRIFRVFEGCAASTSRERVCDNGRERSAAASAGLRAPLQALGNVCQNLNLIGNFLQGKWNLSAFNMRKLSLDPSR